MCCFYLLSSSIHFLFTLTQIKGLILWLVSLWLRINGAFKHYSKNSWLGCCYTYLYVLIRAPKHACATFQSAGPVVFRYRPQVRLVLLPHAVPQCRRPQCRGMVLFAAQLMPPGMHRHIWPGAMQRRLAVEAFVACAFYRHIWLRQISAWLDPGKIHITCAWSDTKTTRR